MARSRRRRVWSVLAGVLAVVVLVPATFAVMVWRDWRQGEDDARDDQARHAEIVRGKLERLRDDGPLEEADVDALLFTVQGSRLISMTERPDDVRVVAYVPGFGAPALGVPGPSYACFGFTIPSSSAPVTVERLSAGGGSGRPEECIG